MYPLENMDSISFQQLAAALATRVIGPGVTPFGRGPDGGRDFTFEGVIPWSGDAGTPGEQWRGYTVFQVKHHAALTHVGTRDARWLLDQIKGELDAWADPDGARVRVPDYLVLVSNIPLTAVSETGGYDMVMRGVQKHLDGYTGDEKSRMAKVKDFTVWDGNKIEGYISAYPEVKWSFNGLLTAADVVGALGRFTQGLPLDMLEPALREHARKSLMDDRYVYFEDAGADPTARTLLSDIAIDLPVVAEDSEERTSMLRHVITHGDRVLRLSEPLVPQKRHILLKGAPGNGKTTLSKFMAQTYRAAFHDSETLVGDLAAVAAGTLDALRRIGCRPPANRRWPMRVNLAEYSDEYGQSEGPNLNRWIAEQIASKAEANVMAYNVKSWLSQWPWLLILDGLDEVTAVEPRRRLIEEIESFIAEADQVNADLLVVLTTRPAGLDEEIAPHHFRTFALGQFTSSQALAYGKQAADARLRAQDERRQMVHDRLAAAAKDENLRHLMQTPLQVLIMSIILESSGRLPPDRFGLFDGYYDTVYKREESKPIPVAKLLADHRAHVDRIHERVGFELHVHAEQVDGMVAEMPAARLEEIVRDQLDHHGYDVDGIDAGLVSALALAARTRLVLVVPIDEGIGFEVRSLQELMAARQLAAGGDALVLGRLRAASPSPHWRNTWIFAAGRIFKRGQEHQRADLVELVRTLDDDAAHRLGRVFPVAPQLALDLMDDGLARQYPALETDLLRTGLRILHHHDAAQPLAVARSLVRSADRSARLKTVIANEIRAALSTTSAPTVRAIQESIQTAVEELEASANVAGMRLITAASPPPPCTQADEAFWESLKENGMDLVSGAEPPSAKALAAALDELTGLHGTEDLHGGIGPHTASLTRALNDTEAAAAIELLLEGLPPTDWRVAKAIREVIAFQVWRQPVGEQLG